MKFSIYLNRLVFVLAKLSHFSPDLVVRLTLSDSNYPYLEQISMVFEPLRFDCITINCTILLGLKIQMLNVECHAAQYSHVECNVYGHCSTVKCWMSCVSTFELNVKFCVSQQSNFECHVAQHLTVECQVLSIECRVAQHSNVECRISCVSTFECWMSCGSTS